MYFFTQFYLELQGKYLKFNCFQYRVSFFITVSAAVLTVMCCNDDTTGKKKGRGAECRQAMCLSKQRVFSQRGTHCSQHTSNHQICIHWKGKGDLGLKEEEVSVWVLMEGVSDV